MKKNGKIRSNIVKESLLDYNNLANTLKENTESAVRDLLKETVLEQYAKILTEDEDEDEYDVEEVDDTDSVNASEDGEAAEGAADGMESDGADEEGDEETDITPETDESGEGDIEGDIAADDASGDDGEGWSEFDKYKVSDDKYDFSNAEDDEIVKVYKLLKDDDQVVVSKEDDKVNIKDNETGAEYIIDLGGGDTSDVASEPAGEGEMEFEVEADGGDEYEDENELNQDEDMNESRIFEIALNEYNSNVGYTDNYQSKDVMTNPGMSEPGKNVNDWDKGVPKDSKKPWSGKKNDKSENQPFTAEKGKTVEQEEAVDDIVEQAIHELKTRQEHTANVGSTSRTDGDNGNRRRKGRSFHTAQRGQETGTGDNPYSNNASSDVNVSVKVENIVNKANKIFEENQALKAALKKFKSTLEEAAVTNVNLGNIIKLVMENTTSKDEKKDIIARFGNEARTVEASKSLYESISRDLKKNSKMNIGESRDYSVNDQKINETQIYRSNDILNSLDLMHRICK